MLKNLTYLFSILILCVSCSAPQENKSQINQNIDLAVIHYKNLMQKLGPEEFPRSFENGKFTTSNSEWWCSGFYPGTLLYLFEETQDSSLLFEAERIMEVLKKEQYNTHTHDLGFMMFCSFGNAIRVAPKPEYTDILIHSAESLSSRFSPTVGCIRSWDSDSTDFLVIIDNMMNLELLFWATKETGDSTFYDIAVTHADNTMKNHFREDNSSYHVLNYDPKTGDVKEKRTAQGLNDESAWARGQSWGLYGFTVMYRETQDEKYLDQATKIADFILNNPKLPKNNIPLWDYNAPADTKRDASAATIMASAFIELDSYVPNKGYLKTVKEIVNSLSEFYLAQPGENGDFLIKHCVGHMPANSEVDVPLTYADYYFIEAMLRLKSL